MFHVKHGRRPFFYEKVFIIAIVSLRVPGPRPVLYGMILIYWLSLVPRPCSLLF